jgi:hypothetical protein
MRRIYEQARLLRSILFLSFVLAHKLLDLSLPQGRATRSAAQFPVSSSLERATQMPLDLKTEWTDADLAKLIGSVEDDRDWRLEVNAQGSADLADKTANPTGDDYDETLHCYFETWMQGTDFVGPSAAGDKTLVGKIAKALRENYPTLKGAKFVYIEL